MYLDTMKWARLVQKKQARTKKLQSVARTKKEVDQERQGDRAGRSCNKEEGKTGRDRVRWDGTRKGKRQWKEKQKQVQQESEETNKG